MNRITVTGTTQILSEENHVWVPLHANREVCLQALNKKDCSQQHDYYPFNRENPLITITLNSGNTVFAEVNLDGTLNENSTDASICLTDDGLNELMNAWCDDDPDQRRGWQSRDLAFEPISLATVNPESDTYVNLEWWFSTEDSSDEIAAWPLTGFPFPDHITY